MEESRTSAPLMNVFTLASFAQAREQTSLELSCQEVGTVTFLGNSIARVAGLPNVRSQEQVRFADGSMGLAFNLDADEVGVVLLNNYTTIKAGSQVQRTGRVLDTPVGEGLLGRVVTALGKPLDQGGPLPVLERRPIERPAPTIMERSPVSVPLQTGIKVVDALVPIGRGQRQLILGDRQTGKTSIALDTMLNQKHQDVICIYCAIGQRSDAVAQLIATLHHQGAMGYCLVVVASGEDTPALQYITPYAATAMAEYFMEQGRDVLIVYDDLIHHARAYRELSLLLRRPPGREAFPGDIFYLHSRLLERATCLRPDLGGGSLTALPIVETEAGNLSAYIPTNLVSITDGQIYLTPTLFQQGLLPAVDVGRSVSRVGGKAQLSAYRSVAGDLRLMYSQFQELESFARFGTRLDESTQQTLARGRRIRAVLQQDQYHPLTVSQQIILLLTANAGLLDHVSIADIPQAEALLCGAVEPQLPDVCQRILLGKKLTDDDCELLLQIATQLLGPMEEK
ncbi:alternate F1F0 ATPase, F1 subunit alpha [Leptolyngbya cf. ectocarpi LEGE 11479]|uniref:ATP synthase subunit alpha n=1 Tax=Leptolyngbya cf. ectocarpi LEGE 11479 TaxID=1828722 RepID=A0A928ZRQ0_LEPEC|nr:alternate F1F0 ATPase, F1 subunit alpha [Leptolyngbya ectocarpi]MBE9066883.1 alternate F1F0 ATPase, F1 subunit alpha [Leptolyngbya cf. ectocarpi LEGE 11479]